MANNDPMEIDVDLRKQIYNKVKRNLTTAIDDAVRTRDLQGAAARAQNIILLRTQRGRFLTEDREGTRKRRYRSETWKQKRAGKGLQTGHVDLFFGEGGLLEAMVARGRMSGGKPTIEVGYFAGISEQKAREIARYMNKQGVGVNHIKYIYVGLTDDETDTVVKYLRGRVGGNLRKGFS